uniref:Uncharacterized protein n=1 Tax=Globisporangium ultimum (strain ATCC 200006 / CBS 805.95 / DAOM BR144) TaxID=431595 RepID=K3WH49_GLOUD
MTADAGAAHAHGSDLFRIRRIFSLATSADGDANGDARLSAAADVPLKIEAMAVHTHEKKQLLALSIAADSSAKTAPQVTALASAHAAAALPSIALGRIPGIEPRKTRLPTSAARHGGDNDAGNAANNKFAKSTSNYLLLRTIEEDHRPRFWRLPVATNAKQQSAGISEKLVALEFSPEGDWLAALSSRKNRLHLIPVLKLIAKQRKKLLDATYDPPYNRELMSVHQSVMNTQMASYLRATNEAGGLNGARYHSQVAGDEEQMSTLEFAVGIGTVTCCRWWRSMNGKNYCLVGGTENLISIVNVEENAEECRCELQNAGTIVSIDLFRENFRKEKRTTMLVKARGDDRVVRYYRVVLEKKFQQQQRRQQKQQSLKDFLKTGSSVTDTSDSNETAPAITATSTTIASTSVDAEGTQSFTTTTASSSSIPSFTTSQSMSFRQPAPPPVYVVKTFPQHFLEDMDFRPQRIKKNSPQICLYAINGMLTSESSLVMYDPNAHSASLYSNFQWTLRNEYVVPSLLTSALKAPEGSEGDAPEGVVDVDIAYCTTDLLLLQGTTEKTRENVSTWISLPTHQGLDEDVAAAAHIVHYLSLHGNEKIERVVQSTARQQISSKSQPDGGSDDAQVIYMLQTQHHVYECRPQWSRLALFKTLCAQSIALRDALSIGYALGIDMASLCQVVAETLCERIHEGKLSVIDDPKIVKWIRELYEVSRVMPSTAVAQLTSIGGASHAIAYAQQLLSRSSSGASESTPTMMAMPYVDKYERQRVAVLLLNLVLQEQLRVNNGSASATFGLDDGDNMDDDNVDSQTDQNSSGQLKANEKWLLEFLATSPDYDTEDIVDACLAHQQVEKAVLVGQSRQEVHLVLQKIIGAGLASFVSFDALRTLVVSGFASELMAPANRLILRAFPLEVQVQVMLAYPRAILAQRDWLVRNLASLRANQCRQLAKCVDPREENLMLSVENKADESRGNHGTSEWESVDVSSSERMQATPEERVELFLTLLLHLNSSACVDVEDNGTALDNQLLALVIGNDDNESKADDEVLHVDVDYSQSMLEQLLREFANRYRPPVMVARCADYGNWTAAASIYEAHGELVEAVEARLQSHKVLRPVVASPSSSTMSSLSFSSLTSSSFAALRRRRQSSDASIESARTDVSIGEISDESEFQDAMREELFELLHSLVVQRHRRNEKNAHMAVTNDAMKAAILARLLVKWFEYGLPKTELEVFLIDPNVYPHVSSLLAKIFFLEVVEEIGGDPPSTVAGSSTSGGTTRGFFEDRDKEWVRKCHHLPFSGQFLFHVCVSFLNESDSSDSSRTLSSSTSSSPSSSVHTNSNNVITQRLLSLVKANVLSNDLSLPVVKIEPHGAQVLGKSDPLETHVKVFTCGHVFPKRVFDEEIVVEFEKRMHTLPMPLFSTKHVLLREFNKHNTMETPCPICAFNKISTLVDQHQKLKKNSTTTTSTRIRATPTEHASTIGKKVHQPQTQVPYYFLHAPKGQQHQQQQYHHQSRRNSQATDDHQQRWRHEPWEWRATP